MRVLVTGGDGQLGRVLQQAPERFAVTALARRELDLTQHADMVGVVRHVRPNVVVNAAAYTAVDGAESDEAAAQAVNSDGVAALAQVCASLDIRLIHISTDFVFDGGRGNPYSPEDDPRPLNAYGRSKLAGERRILGIAGLHAHIVRTAWLYGATGSNFVQTMLRLFRLKDEIAVVADQCGTPTSTSSLATCIWKLIDNPGAPHVLHYTDAGVASWFDFAVAIFEEATAIGLIDRHVDIRPTTSREYGAVAARPSYSVLDTREARNVLQLNPVHWRQELRRILREMVE